MPYNYVIWAVKLTRKSRIVPIWDILQFSASRSGILLSFTRKISNVNMQHYDVHEQLFYAKIKINWVACWYKKVEC